MTIAELRAKLRAAFERMQSAAAAIEALPADSTDEQRTAARTEFDTAETEHRSVTEDLRRAEALEEARRNAPPPANDTPPGEQRGGGGGGGGGPTRVEREPGIYDRRSANSYFLDLGRMMINGDASARQRLDDHAREIDAEVERRSSEAERRHEAELEILLRDLPAPLRRGLQESGLLELRRGDNHRTLERRDLSRTDGQGGHFVPPIWLLDEYAEAARAGRPFVNATRRLDLPSGTDSINVPRIATGTATGVQTADNAAVTETDLTDAIVTIPVRTIAGQQDVPIQLLDQSPIAFDEIVFADLMADYNFRCEDQAFSGSGAAGQVLGILGAGGNAITYTDASPTVPELYPKIADALNQARTARKRPITHGWIAPRRYYWASAALDANNRPLVAPQLAGPTNALGVPTGEPGGGSGEDIPLWMLAPLHQSDAVPINLGAGSNEDRIVVTRMQDHLWFEGVIRARAMSEVLSGTLQVRLQVYNYVGFTAARYPTGTSIIAGTGLVTPTF